MRDPCAAIALIAALGAAGARADADAATAADADARASPAAAAQADAAAAQTGAAAATSGPASPEGPRVLPALDGCRWIPEPPASPAVPVRFTVIHLWGPWSSDSMTYMPRLSRIARERAAEGVLVRGITREMPGHSTERIEESVRRLGGRITYPIGIAPADLHAQVSALCSVAPADPGGRSASAEKGSADRDTTLVADATGTVAATCTPAELEHVLSRMIAGTWTGPHEIDALRRETRAMDSLVRISMSDPALAAGQVEEMVAMHPHRMRDFASRRIVILLRAGRADEAAAAMRTATDEWMRLQDAAELTALATLWMDSRVNSTGRDLRMAADAAEAAATISGDLDPNPWLLLMRARVAAGDPSGARAAGEKALAIGDERMRGRIAQLLARIPQDTEAGDGARQQPK